MVIALFAGLGTAAGIFLFFKGLTAPPVEDALHARLAAYGNRPPSLEEIEMSKPFSERIMKPIIAKMSAFLQTRTPQSSLDKIKAQLDAAGNPNNLTVQDFLGLTGFAALAGFGIAFLLSSGQAEWSLPVKILVPLGGAFLGSKLPGMWLGGKAGSRQKEMMLALPDALDLLTISVEAGMGFEQALSKVVSKWDNALTAEFGRMLREQRMGKSRRESLRDMGQRATIAEVVTFTSAIIQADQLGVSIARILQIQSTQMRVKRRQKAEKLAHEAPIKMTLPMVLFMMPALWIIILGPIWPFIAGMGGK